MTPGLALFPGLRAPPLPVGIDLRCADAREVFASARAAVTRVVAGGGA